MSKLIFGLLTLVLAVANALADDPDKHPALKEQRGGPTIMNLLGYPPKADEARRESAGVPRERWDKMNGAEKAAAVEKARAAEAAKTTKKPAN